MTITEFQSMTEMEKIKILIRYGILIGELKQKDVRAFTYQVQNFYVETRYSLQTDDLLNIQSFSNIEVERVDLNNIRLISLYQNHAE